MTIISKATSKGQITLPIAWRKKFKTDQFALTFKDDLLKIKPVKLNDIFEEKEGDITIFNADRDNNGKGMLASDFLKILKDVNGQNKKISKKNSQKVKSKVRD